MQLYKCCVCIDDLKYYKIGSKKPFGLNTIAVM